MTDLPDLLADLVRIPSVNPDLEPGSGGESAIAGFCRDWLTQRGVRAWLEDVAPGRPNVVAEVGAAPGPTLVLCAHLDTVSAAGMEIAPFEPRLEAGKLFGRGSYDMKGGVAAVLYAMAELAQAELRGRVLAALVVDEEFASAGAYDFVQRHRADACILTEPSALDLVLAHKGFVWLDVVTSGIAAHGSRWEAGESAISRMAPVVTALTAFDSHALRARTHVLCGAASLHCATIRGGTGASTYAAECVLRVERRTLPGEDTDTAVAELLEVVHAVAPTATVRVVLAREPLETAGDAAVATSVRRAASAELGRAPRDAGVAYWMDAAVFAAAGISAVNIGGSGAGAHAPVEWADLASHETLARILARAAADFLATCGDPAAV